MAIQISLDGTTWPLEVPLTGCMKWCVYNSAEGPYDEWIGLLPQERVCLRDTAGNPTTLQERIEGAWYCLDYKERPEDRMTWTPPPE